MGEGAPNAPLELAPVRAATATQGGGLSSLSMPADSATYAKCTKSMSGMDAEMLVRVMGISLWLGAEHGIQHLEEPLNPVLLRV